MSEHQKSILSQVTLDSHSKSYSNPTIHAGELNYQFYKYSKARKACPQTLPFGSSSSRVSRFLQPISNSNVVSYIQVYPKNTKNEQLVTSQAPFGTKENRFIQEKKKIPGPGAYNIEEKTKEVGGIISGTIRKSNIENETGLGPGSYSVQSYKNDKDFKMREKIKQMIKQKREKYTIKRQKSQCTLKMPQISKNKEEVRVEQSKQNGKGIDRFWLKQSTEKYLCPSYNSLNVTYQPIKSSSNNFSASFIEKNDNPFHSYIQPSCSPSPTRYRIKQTIQPTNNIGGSTFNSKVKRDPFKTEDVVKQKIKLSCIL